MLQFSRHGGYISGPPKNRSRCKRRQRCGRSERRRQSSLSSESGDHYLNLEITNIVEQESLDLSIYSSADGATWGPKPRATFPQKFYRGPHPLLLDLTALPEIKFIRAHWEVNRWGRGSETPMFEFQVAIKEVPPEILKEATAEAQALA